MKFLDSSGLFSKWTDPIEVIGGVTGFETKKSVNGEFEVFTIQGITSIDETEQSYTYPIPKSLDTQFKKLGIKVGSLVRIVYQGKKKYDKFFFHSFYVEEVAEEPEEPAGPTETFESVKADKTPAKVVLKATLKKK